jgi:hypothetical protein
MSKHLIPKHIARLVRKNPHTAGITAALVALGGLAALGMTNPHVRARARELKDSLMRRLSPLALPTQEGAALATVSQPY